MELTLNIYDHTVITKVYKAETYEIKFGTIEDLLEVLDIEKMDDEMELAKMVLQILPKVKPFLKDVFPGLTDEELRNTRIREMVQVFIELFRYSVDEIKSIGSGEKN